MSMFCPSVWISICTFLTWKHLAIGCPFNFSLFLLRVVLGPLNIAQLCATIHHVTSCDQ